MKRNISPLCERGEGHEVAGGFRCKASEPFGVPLIRPLRGHLPPGEGKPQKN